MPNHVVSSPFSGAVVCDLPFDRGADLSRQGRPRRRGQARLAGQSARRDRARQVAAALAYFEERREEIARDVTLQMGKPIARGAPRGRHDARARRHMIAIAPAALAAGAPARAGGARAPHRARAARRRARHRGLELPAAHPGQRRRAGARSRATPCCSSTARRRRSAAAHFARAFATLSVRGAVTRPRARPRARGRARRGPAHRPRRVHRARCAAGTRSTQAARGRASSTSGLELGGKDPAYVAEDADLDFAVADIVDGACYNAGQIVLRRRARLRAPAPLRRRSSSRPRPRCARYRLGDPLDERDDDGPARVDRTRSTSSKRQVADARARAARGCSRAAQRLETHGRLLPADAARRLRPATRWSCRRRASARSCPSRASRATTRRSR